MSTRSIVVITGVSKYKQPQTVRMYQHSDGYPTGVLPTLRDAIAKAQAELNEHNEYWSKALSSSKPKPLNVEHVVGKVIGESTCVYGIGCNIDQYEDDSAVYDEALKPKHLSNQSDLEWIYVVDLSKKSIKIHGGGYTGEAPQKHLKRKPVNPVKYADQLRDEFQNKERKETLKLIGDIEALGFKVNPTTKKKGA